MIIRDRKYVSRTIKNFRQTGQDIRFHNRLADVSRYIGLELLKLPDYECVDDEAKKADLGSWKKNRRLIWDGVLGFNNGYGKSGMHMCEALGDITDLYSTSGHWHGYNSSRYSDQIKKILEKRIPEGNDLIVQYNLVINLQRHQTPSIGFTMFETTKISTIWIDNLNDSLDYLIVPCKDQKKAFIDSGFKKRVYVSPIGVSASIYKPQKVEKNKEFVFGISGNLTYRKGVDLLIKAFEEEFPADKYDDVALFIKDGTSRASYWWNRDIGLEEYMNDRRINFVSEDWTDEELVNDFYNVIDCYVSPSRGEGMGLTTIEAMLCGVPTILSDCSGLRDQYKKGCNLKVTTDIVPVPQNRYGYPEDWRHPAQEWWEPRVSSLRRKMRWVYDNRKDAKKMGENGRRHALNNFTAEVCADKLVKTIDKIVNHYEQSNKK